MSQKYSNQMINIKSTGTGTIRDHRWKNRYFTWWQTKGQKIDSKESEIEEGKITRQDFNEGKNVIEMLKTVKDC